MTFLRLILNLRTNKITTGKLAVCSYSLSPKNMTTNVQKALLKAQSLQPNTEAKLE